MSFTLLGQENRSGYDVLDAPCKLTTTFDSSDVCLLKSDRADSIVGLHYGSMNTKQLVIEVLRTEVTDEKLREFAKAIRVAINIATPGHLKENFHNLDLSIKESKIVALMPDRELSSFYISSVLVGTLDDADSIGDNIRSVFGNQAIAIIYAVPR